MPKTIPASQQKDQMRREYEIGKTTLGQLAKKYNVSRSTLSSWAKREDWSSIGHQQAGQKTLKLLKVEKGALTCESDTAETKSRINEIIKEWDEERKGHQVIIKDRIAGLTALARKIDILLKATKPTAENIRDLKAIADIQKNTATSLTNLVASHRQVFSEEIETIRAQQANEEKVTDSQMEHVQGLFLLPNESSMDE